MKQKKMKLNLDFLQKLEKTELSKITGGYGNQYCPTDITHSNGDDNPRVEYDGSC